MNTFHFASRLSQSADLDRALDEVCGPALAALGGTPDLALLFVSADRGPDCEQLAAAVCDRLGTDRLVGCTGESLVGVGCEVEGGPALSLWLAKPRACRAAHAPDVHADPGGPQSVRLAG